jgi:low affinity Fe/Cu permease
MDQFRRVADATAAVVGSPGVFSATVALTALWLILGPVFRFSDTWQLTMNTAASQVTCTAAAKHAEPGHPRTTIEA